jgi:prepilin-type processing-associated H-X9-DG protein
MARTLVCTTNLHAMARASRMYAGDNDGYVPRDYYRDCNDPTKGNSGHYLFAAKLSPYLDGPRIDFRYDTDQAYLYSTFSRMDSLQCPGLDDPDHVLDYVINGIDFKLFARMLRQEGREAWGSGPASRVEDVPAAPSDVGYIVEANAPGLSPYEYWYHDIFKPEHMTFDLTGGPSSMGSARMIHASDTRHLGRTTIVFFDGHAGPRRLHPDDLPVQLFNPLVRP